MLLSSTLPRLVFGAFVLATTTQGSTIGLTVEHISVALTSESITQNLASLNFDVTNSLSTPAMITSMSAKFGTLGLPILSFNQPFDSFVVPAMGSANSGTISNVTLNEGVLSTLQIVLLPAMDIIEAIMSIRMQQNGVPTNFTLNLT